MKKQHIHLFLALTAALTLTLTSCSEKLPDDAPPPPGEEQIDYVYKQTRSAKRGVSCNTIYPADFDVFKSSISWFWNWGASFNNTLDAAFAAAGVDFCPMAWNGNYNANAIRNYVAAHPSCRYLMAFNEPNLTDQANMTPAAAAAVWPGLRNLAKELGLLLVAPSMNYGTMPNYGSPIDWLDEFFSLPGVSLDDVDVISVHCYMNSPSALKGYVELFRKYGKPVWMTEFCAWEGTVSAERQREYMSDVINYMESEPLIERYSWFKYDGNPAGNPHYALRPTGNNRGELSDLGTIYTSISSLDKTTAYAPDEIVPAEHYSNTNMSDVAGSSGWAPGVQLKICSDPAGGILEVANFGLPKWLEYRLDLSTPPTLCQIAIRYAAIVDSKCKITIDGKDTEIELPATASATDWRTLRHRLELPDGSDSVYTVRFTPTKGLLSLNWWRIETENNE
ncbi:MAG: DUF5010 C-terminal domain-containing protein [Prevotellaceae bacterium]|jgi:hypothetical protein|nr:DUF5010 C-terminal domain-containing protein [Prevotellaceae bacterium]